MHDIRNGQFYKDPKDRLYQIVAVAEHSETGEQMVVYQALYGNYRTYVRPYDMFVSEVDHRKYPEVKQKYRFELVAPEEQAFSGGRLAAGPRCQEGHVSEKTEQEAAPEQKKPAGGLPAPERKGPAGELPVSEQGGPAENPQGPVSGGVNPILLEFLDADTLEEKMHILSFYRNKMDEALLNSIAISLDVVVEKEGIQQKYDEIMNCLSMMERFECNRFR